MSDGTRSMRWDPYIGRRGTDLDAFWKSHLGRGKRRVLVVVGRGFDWRALCASDRILAAGGSGDRSAWLLAYDVGSGESAERARRTAENVVGLKKRFGAERTTEIPIRIGMSGNRSVTSRNVMRAVSRVNELATFDDVVVDVSAMPRMVALTAIAQLIALLDEIEATRGTQINLHAVVAESVAADHSSQGGSVGDSVANVVGFSGHMDEQSTGSLPRVWFPVLGEGQGVRMQRIGQEVNPDEVCPVIPFPSRDARRGDGIIGEYRQTLFEEYRIEPQNILHACEYNPFEAYKAIFGAIDRYRGALAELGGCKVFVSPLSSKLLSVGALLACYDHRCQPDVKERVFVGIPYLESVSYSDPVDNGFLTTELYSMWLRGEWET